MQITTNLTVSPNMKMNVTPQTSSVAMGPTNTEIITLTPPVGYLMKINSLYLNAPAVAGSGSGGHTFTLYGNVGQIGLVTSNYNQALQILGFLPHTPSVMTFPTTESGFASSIKDVLFDNANPLYIQYTNSTNVSTGAATRTYTVQYILIPENTNF